MRKLMKIISEYISEAKEENNSDQELTEESCKTLHEDLLLLRTCQDEEHSVFIQQIEEMRKAWKGKEVLDDYVFGVDK